MTDNPAKNVVRAGEALFGNEWGAPLARALNMNPRTLQRLKLAVACGQLYPVAPGVQTALARILRQRAVELQQLAAEMEDQARARQLQGCP